jgi:hydroxyacylglutathione hydrolase
MSTVITIETAGLGDRSYVAHDGEVAAVVDPQRDIDRVYEALEPLGLRVGLVAETHLHNDYVTGGYALAAETGAPYVVPGGDRVAFERVPAGDGDTFRAGRLALTALHTPGHTPHHTSYGLSEDGGPVSAVFTGGSMLFGAVGRTDLIGAERTDELTRAQYRSVRRLAAELGPAVTVHPTHGFGSFCSATPVSGDHSTIGEQRRENLAVTTDDEDAFVAELVAGLSAYPAYYAHMGPANAAGPPRADLSPPEETSPDELRRRIDAGEWVVDLRQRRAFARDHVEGTISVELGDPFATFLGWTMTWGAPLTLIGETPDQLLAARRALSRIGVDRVRGGAQGTTGELGRGRTGSYPVARFADLADRDPGGLVVLDVRRDDEWAAGHLRGAVHIPFWELERRIGDVPAGEVWVHCASGFRASISASMLARAGRAPVLVDEDWERAAAAGLDVVA